MNLFDLPLGENVVSFSDWRENTPALKDIPSVGEGVSKFGSAWRAVITSVNESTQECTVLIEDFDVESESA